MSKPPTPPALRLLKNDKAHAHRYKNDSNPEPSSDKPIPPSHLSERAKEIFVEIVEKIEEMYPISATDEYALVLYANNQEQLEYLELYLRENGVTYEQVSMHGSTMRKRPEVDVHTQCKATAMKILSEFGLTPVARARIKHAPKKEDKKDNPFAKFDKSSNE